MRKVIPLFIFLLFAGVVKTYAEPDDFGIWSTFNLKYNFTPKIYGSTYLEFRTSRGIFSV